jgi:hypothetical protein
VNGGVEIFLMCRYATKNRIRVGVPASDRSRNSEPRDAVVRREREGEGDGGVLGIDPKRGA